MQRAVLHLKSKQSLKWALIHAHLVGVCSGSLLLSSPCSVITSQVGAGERKCPEFITTTWGQFHSHLSVLGGVHGLRSPAFPSLWLRRTKPRSPVFTGATPLDHSSNQCSSSVAKNIHTGGFKALTQSHHYSPPETRSFTGSPQPTITVPLKQTLFQISPTGFGTTYI